jgi:hypothetical protein
MASHTPHFDNDAALCCWRPTRRSTHTTSLGSPGRDRSPRVARFSCCPAPSRISTRRSSREGDALVIRISEHQRHAGKRRARRPEPVAPGDSIRIGNHVLSLELRSPAEPRPIALRAPARRLRSGARGRILPPKARPADSGAPACRSPSCSAAFPCGPSRRILRRLSRGDRKAAIFFDRERLFHVRVRGRGRRKSALPPL